MNGWVVYHCAVIIVGAIDQIARGLCFAGSKGTGDRVGRPYDVHLIASYNRSIRLKCVAEGVGFCVAFVVGLVADLDVSCLAETVF